MDCFQILKNKYGTHKAAGEALSVKYRTWNEWRYNQEKIPEHIKAFLTLAAEKASHEINDTKTANGGAK